MAELALIKTAFRAGVIESAANTFTETEIDLNLSAVGGYAFIMTDLILAHTAAMDAADEATALQLCYTTQTAMISQSSAEQLWRWDWKCMVSTNGGSVTELQRHFVMGAGGLAIARSSLFFGIKSTGLAGTATGKAVLRGYYAKVTPEQYFKLAQTA